MEHIGGRKTNFKGASQLRPTTEVDQSAQAVRPDGNTVSLEKELVELNKNLLGYEYSTNYLSSSYKKLKSAIAGRIL